MPIAVIVLPAGARASSGALAWRSRSFSGASDWRRVFALAAGIGVAEWLRGNILSGFPWNSIGYALTAGEILMQSAALFGLYALNVIAVAIFAAPAAMAPVDGERRRNVVLACSRARGGRGARPLRSAAPVAGADRIRARRHDPHRPAGPRPAAEMGSGEQGRGAQHLLSAERAGRCAASPGTVLVWPESAFPFPLTQEPARSRQSLSCSRRRQRSSPAPTAKSFRRASERQVFNTIYVIGDDGTILHAYDKVHLVPFGEYLPGSEYLPESALDRYGMRQLAPSSFSPGPRSGARSNCRPAPPFLPLICYEIIFAGDVVGDEPRPDFLLNVTNDGWFGRTTGPYQHFHQARVSSVEEGLPLIRAANTGISAVIDAFGRSVAQSRLGETTMIEARLPAAIDPPLYAQWRRLIFIAISGCLHVVSRHKESLPARPRYD